MTAAPANPPAAPQSASAASAQPATTGLQPHGPQSGSRQPSGAQPVRSQPVGAQPVSAQPIAPLSAKSPAANGQPAKPPIAVAGTLGAPSAAPARTAAAASPQTDGPPPAAADPGTARPGEAPAARLMAIPRLAAGGRWRVEAMRSLSEGLLLWFTRGQGRVTVRGITRGYGPNTAVFIPAGTMHGFEVGQQVFGTAVYFPPSAALALPEEPLHLRIRDNPAQVELNLILDAVGRELTGAKPGHARAAHHHLGLLSVWLERQALAQSGDEVPHPASARRLATLYAEALERDFRSGRGVADYAAALGVTPTHLSRICRTTSGRSAKAILSDRVIFEARRLLMETRLPVQEVAEALGFTSAAYFTRAFQHHTGSTPSDFRRLH